MKKRILAALLAAAMLLCCGQAALAEEQIYFTAVDERVLDLNDETMPFWFGGYLYVAATVFRESGVGYSYNVVTQTLVLYDSSRSLVCDVATGSVTTGQGELYDHVCVTRNGVTFVAASPVASYFGRTYSNSRVNHGYLIRVKTGTAALPDSLFIETATYLINSKYQQYQNRSTTAETPAKPEVPEETPEPAEADGRSIYLCFLAEDAERVDGWLDALERRGARAAFYFTEEALSRCGGQLRRLAVSGSSIGLMPDGGDGALDQLSRMNRTLFAAAGMKTRLVYAPDADRSALTAAGYCPLKPDIDRSKYGLTTAGGASALLRQIHGRRGAASVWLGGNVTALRVLLTAAAEGEDRLLPMTETAA